MNDLPRRLELLAYVRTFFPDSFEIGLERSKAHSDWRVLTIRESATRSTATYEGPAFAILDICSMSNIACDLHNRLRAEAQPQPSSARYQFKRA